MNEKEILEILFKINLKNLNWLILKLKYKKMELAKKAAVFAIASDNKELVLFRTIINAKKTIGRIREL